MSHRMIIIIFWLRNGVYAPESHVSVPTAVPWREWLNTVSPDFCPGGQYLSTCASPPPSPSATPSTATRSAKALASPSNSPVAKPAPRLALVAHEIWTLRGSEERDEHRNPCQNSAGLVRRVYF